MKYIDQDATSRCEVSLTRLRLVLLGRCHIEIDGQVVKSSPTIAAFLTRMVLAGGGWVFSLPVGQKHNQQNKNDAGDTEACPSGQHRQDFAGTSHAVLRWFVSKVVITVELRAVSSSSDR